MHDLWVTFCNFVCQFVVCGSSHLRTCVMTEAEIRLKLHESQREQKTIRGTETVTQTQALSASDEFLSESLGRFVFDNSIKASFSLRRFLCLLAL